MAGSARTGAPIPYSLLDLAPVCEGSTPAQAFANSLDLARHAEALGYTRYWLAEHHNMPGIASAATSLLIGHIAGGTSTLRVGAGGVMLPNHAPLQVAEQFGTLASLYPDRIDLGLGRAPGTDQATAKALRRYYDSAEAFPQDVQEVLHYFEPVQPGQAVQAVPGGGLELPVWILGSSLFGARLAAALGLPELVARLLQAGADLHATDAQGLTPLHCATLYGFTARDRTRLVALLDTLLLAGADPQQSAAGGVTPLLLLLGARAEPGTPSTEEVVLAGLERLLDEGVSLDVQDPRGFGPLHLASLHGLLRVVSRLLRAGADPELRDTLNRTPREIAVMRGFIDVAAEFVPVAPGAGASMARFLRDRG